MHKEETEGSTVEYKVEVVKDEARGGGRAGAHQLCGPWQSSDCILSDIGSH